MKSRVLSFLLAWVFFLGIDAVIVLYKYKTIVNHLDEFLRISILFVVFYLLDRAVLRKEEV